MLWKEGPRSLVIMVQFGNGAVIVVTPVGLFIDKFGRHVGTIVTSLYRWVV